MNFSRQALLGIGMIVGGSVMLYAMVQQIGASDEQAQLPVIVNESATDQASTPALTTDIDTEKRILAQKQKERAARVAEQERRAEQFLAEQESAEAQALAKARAENQRYRENSEPEPEETDPEAAPSALAQPISSTITTEANKPTSKDEEDTKRLVQAADNAVNEARLKREEAARQQAQAAAAKKAEEQAVNARKKQAEEQVKAEAAKNAPPTAPTDYTVKRGDGLLRLARQYNVPVEALAQANNVAPDASLQVGQELTIPSRKQIQRLEREAQAAEQARAEQRKKEEALAKKSADAKREAQQKLRAARQEVKETDAKGSFGVQVALAGNQKSADEVAKKFKDAGYQVKTSATSRGVRVIVGPERGKVAALALKDKVNSDPNVDTTGAWVLYWR